MPSTTATASESGSRVLFSLLLFLLLLLMFSFSLNEVNGSEMLGNGSIEVGEIVPMVKLGEEEMVLMMNNNFSSMGRRRLLGSFRICAPCTCCAKGYCLPSPCCYSINCNIPNRPFGFCSFTPKTCNCFNCHL